MSNSWMTSRKGAYAMALVVAMISFAGVALAGGEEFCMTAKADLKGSTFTARVPLYEIRIDPGGIREIERDEEEIRQGAKTIIMNVECGSKRVAMTLAPDGPGADVEIYFMISREGRLEPDARKDFDHMMSYVFEEAPGSED